MKIKNSAKTCSESSNSLKYMDISIRHTVHRRLPAFMARPKRSWRVQIVHGLSKSFSSVQVAEDVRSSKRNYGSRNPDRGAWNPERGKLGVPSGIQRREKNAQKAPSKIATSYQNTRYASEDLLQALPGFYRLFPASPNFVKLCESLRIFEFSGRRAIDDI